MNELLLTLIHRPDGSALAPGLTFAVSGRARLGRSGADTLLLADRTVSRDHAEVWCTAEGWRVRNRSRNNGVFVDGARVAPGAEAPLPDAARLQLGGLILSVQHVLPTQPWTEVLTSGRMKAVQTPRFRIRRDGDACTVHVDGHLAALPPAAAHVLAVLAEHPGEVVHTWDLLDAAGDCNLPQAVSAIRRALRSLVEAGRLDAALLEAALPSSPPSDLAQLLRRVVFARRKHGYGLALPAEWLSVEDAG